ncbi:MAG: hypothetical protein BHW65_05725 [Verrucomicrobia bacterium CAG:312_58_20]|nr:MAG: hypothetical protein BHW65_05725 [Verrucomicrobia bacterium CAG:312_58_20]
MRKFLGVLAVLSAFLPAFSREKWTEEEANAWYAGKPFMAGCNFIPSDASNQIEMWSSATFNPALIDRELAMAQKLGFNTMRVFLSDAVWLNEGEKFLDNVEKYLQIADSRGIKTLFVFFDSCWNAYSKYGKQPEPSGRHNSNWLKSPSFEILGDESRWPELEKYVVGTVSRFKDDPRVVGWDVFNEPGQIGVSVDERGELRGNVEMFKKTEKLLKLSFEWARSANPSQPITAGVYADDKSAVGRAMNPIQLSESDIISFHCYGDGKSMRANIEKFKKLNRPVFCTEYMARPFSAFDPCLGIMKECGVAAYNWGLVNGRTHTDRPWAHLEKDYPKGRWFHDVLKPDGSPYDPAEAEYIKKTMGVSEN